jgi:hypothetical protein
VVILCGRRDKRVNNGTGMDQEKQESVWVSTRFGTFFGTFDFGVFLTHIKRLVPLFI